MRQRWTRRKPNGAGDDMSMRVTCPLLLLSLLLMPSFAAAQSAIAGTVTDESGGVLPGVTVEASSPVLIEKTRTVVTDGQGRFNIVNLRSGAYTVNFTLTGFNGVRRDDL